MSDMSFASYASLEAGWKQLMELDSTATAEKPEMLEKLRTATAMIDSELSDVGFMPRSMIRYFDAPTAYTDGSVTGGRDLRLGEPLRELISATNGDGDVLTSADYLLLPREGPPYTTIRMRADGTKLWMTNISGDPISAIAINGVWAASAERFISGMWYRSGDTVKTAIASAATDTVHVDDVVGSDVYRRTPRFSPGQLLRVTVSGVTEYMELLWQDATADDLYVARGARGTDPLTTIPLNTPIEIWQCDRRIEYACARQAAFMMRSSGLFAKSIENAMGGTTRLNGDLWDTKAANVIDGFRTQGSGGTNELIILAV